jgi:hypothetical protein
MGQWLPPRRREDVCMLTLNDCIALCELNEGEVLAIAQHERIPEIAAAELANYLVRRPDGELTIKAMIRDDITSAISRCDRTRELALKALLRNFVLQHPRCEERHRQALGFPDRRAGTSPAV